jgi:hypothetical protein
MRGVCAMPAGEAFPMTPSVEALPLVEFLTELREIVR